MINAFCSYRRTMFDNRGVSVPGLFQLFELVRSRTDLDKDGFQ